jgi:WD40 repeat protein
VNGRVRLYDMKTLQYDVISVQNQLKSTSKDLKFPKIPEAYQTIWTGRFIPNRKQFFSLTAGNGTLGIYDLSTKNPVQIMCLGFGGNEKGEFDGGEGALIALDWNFACSTADPSLSVICCLDQTIRTFAFNA